MRHAESANGVEEGGERRRSAMSPCSVKQARSLRQHTAGQLVQCQQRLALPWAQGSVAERCVCRQMEARLSFLRAALVRRARRKRR